MWTGLIKTTSEYLHELATPESIIDFGKCFLDNNDVIFTANFKLSNNETMRMLLFLDRF